MFTLYSGQNLATEVSTYIFNGTQASTTTFPSIATLYYDAIDYTGLYGMYCGATILDSQHILTAAHCLYDGEGNLNEDYLIYTSVALQMEDESQFLDGSVEVIRAEEFYAHPDYIDSSSSSSSSWPNDIAIIKLEYEMNLEATAYVARASESESSTYRDTDNRQSFIAVGHGYTETGDGEELLQTTLTYQSSEECDFTNLSDSQLCMSGELDSETLVRNSTCSGDSGGPLYWYNGTTYVQAGITSYGWTNCFNAGSDDTSVFTEVSDYSSWIDSVLSGNETADYTVTESDRGSSNSIVSEEETESTTTESSSSSGGSYSIISLLLLLIAAYIRPRAIRFYHDL